MRKNRGRRPSDSTVINAKLEIYEISTVSKILKKKLELKMLE